ncbi:MAG: tRNA-binding protein [Chloroflexota bacterium]|nr:tRNA-binding protein [Chloroflexota bacterium]
MITFDDFLKVDLRVGEIVEVRDFPAARKPAYQLRVFFGDEIGHKWSSAQVTNYAKDDLIGMLVIGVVNFPLKRIAGFASECLLVGVPDADGNVSLLTPSRAAVVGGRVY